MDRDDIRLLAEQAFNTPGTVPAFKNGFYTVTPDELARFAALAQSRDTALLRQALEALEESCSPRLSRKHADRYDDTIDALRKRLEATNGS